MRAFDGRNAKAKRLASGKRIEIVAVEIGRSVDSVRAYEAGRVDPPASVVAALADALGADPGQFYSELGVSA